MIYKTMKFVTTCLLLSLIFFAKVYAEEPIGFVTEIKGMVKKINEWSWLQRRWLTLECLIISFA